jgi:catechol 2,3-dioxygenase-like lactoylglutathione lyase family enzyme
MLKFHHVGCLVENIDDSIGIYQKLFDTKTISEKIFIEAQGVYVCFVEMANNEFVELVQPVDDDSVVAKLRRKGFNYYHMGYMVEDIMQTIADLEAMNFKFLNIFNSEAFGGKRCSFLYSPDMHMVELIEA